MSCYDKKAVIEDLDEKSKDIINIVKDESIRWDDIKTDDEVKKLTKGKLNLKAELDFWLKSLYCVENVSNVVEKMINTAKKLLKEGFFEVLRGAAECDILDDELKKKKAIEFYECVSELCADVSGFGEFIDAVENSENYKSAPFLNSVVIYFRQWFSTFMLIKSIFEKTFLCLIDEYNKSIESLKNCDYEDYNCDSNKVKFCFPFSEVTKEFDVASFFKSSKFKFKEHDGKRIFCPIVDYTCYCNENVLVWDYEI